MSDINVMRLKDTSPQTFLSLCGCHAFGAGVHVTRKQWEFETPIDEITVDQLKSIINDFQQTDPYELCLNYLRIPADSNNKKVLDQVVLQAGLTGMNTETPIKDFIFTPEGMRVYMQVLFDAGVTFLLALAEKE